MLLQYGYSCLHCACRGDGKEAIISLLLSRGADVNVRSSSGYTPIHLSCRERNGHHVTSMLLECPLIEMNAQDKWGRTPLHWSCRGNNFENALLLLEHGAAVDLKDCDGQTADKYLDPSYHPAANICKLFRWNRRKSFLKFVSGCFSAVEPSTTEQQQHHNPALMGLSHDDATAWKLFGDMLFVREICSYV